MSNIVAFALCTTAGVICMATKWNNLAAMLDFALAFLNLLCAIGRVQGW